MLVVAFLMKRDLTHEKSPPTAPPENFDSISFDPNRLSMSKDDMKVAQK
jgi:hypothetical protein